MIIARFTCDILRPIPVGEIRVQARLARPGRSVELLEAVASGGGRGVARATAWRVLRTDGPPVPPRPAPPPPLPAETPPAPPREGWVDGYLSAIEWRPGPGPLPRPGPGPGWGRVRLPPAADEETGPLERVLAVADSGNGVASALDIRRWQFINPELTVHLQREAA